MRNTAASRIPDMAANFGVGMRRCLGTRDAGGREGGRGVGGRRRGTHERVRPVVRTRERHGRGTSGRLIIDGGGETAETRSLTGAFHSRQQCAVVEHVVLKRSGDLSWRRDSFFFNCQSVCVSLSLFFPLPLRIRDVSLPEEFAISLVFNCES